MKKKEVSEYYDGFSERQLKIGANERLVFLYKKMLSLGLKSDSNVLELGCGVGIFTRLLSKKITSGNIEAVDLSGKSIEIAQHFLQKQNINFNVADVVTYQPKLRDLGFVTLMDVIEHIPLDLHEKLFQKISSYISEKTFVVINIPNPDYIEYGQQNHPDKMQIIDQPVYLLPLLQHLDNAQLEILYFEKYGIWEVEDYHFMVIRKKRTFQLKHLSDQRTFFEKLKHKVSVKVNQLKFQ